jgi:hypothetical protein
VRGGGGGERVWEGEYRAKYCVHMYVNGKMTPVEMIQEMEGK